MSLRRSLLFSPACQRRLQRCIEAGIGFALRHAALANWKKSGQGLAPRSMSESSTPCCCAGGGAVGPFWLAQAAAAAASSATRAGFMAPIRLSRRKISIREPLELLGRRSQRPAGPRLWIELEPAQGERIEDAAQRRLGEVERGGVEHPLSAAQVIRADGAGRVAVQLEVVAGKKGDDKDPVVGIHRGEHRRPRTEKYRRRCA